MFLGFDKNLVGQVAAVGEFHRPCTASGTGFDDRDSGLDIFVVEDRHQADFKDCVEDFHAVVLCHDGLPSFL